MSSVPKADDVRRLITAPSDESRRDIAQKVATDYQSGRLGETERRLAEEIFRALAQDVVLRVREALANALKKNPDVPHDIARTLANDVESVALPVLRFSPALTDEDLLEIVRTHGPARQRAVAERASVSEAVSESLIDCGDADAVAALMANNDAAISDRSLDSAVSRFGHANVVSESMARRHGLPISVAEKLVTLVSEELRAHILHNHQLSAETISDLVWGAREKAVLGLIPADAGIAEVRELVATLYRRERLTPGILLRALCTGDSAFFEVGIALLAQIPLAAARRLVHDEGADRLAGLLAQAGMPASYHPMFIGAIEAIHEIQLDGRDDDLERFQRHIIERLLTRSEGDDSSAAANDLDYLLAKLDRSGGTAPTR